MHLFEFLSKNQKANNIFKSEEYIYYINNRHLFSEIDIYHFLSDSRTSFDIIRANIIIQAIKNKEIIDKAITFAFKESQMKTEDVDSYIHDRLIGCPYIDEDGSKIYIPIFPRTINSYYYYQYGKILTAPYSKLLTHYKTSCIDLFEMYNFSLFHSLFTKLITLYKDEHMLIAYHYDFRTIYVINDQGRLDAQISLFDKYMKRIENNHIIARLKPVVDCYVKNDKYKMCQALVDNKLISKKLMDKFYRSEAKHKRSLEKKAK